ncbi:spore protease YyaC [Paenibacillus kobensis]|uniref:spore protease YyaC n=1 Tax=Paenibacillus kobensis TaxID=59841 RepID=UPI000FDAA318|nr:spore protease YyaC [Paenibacillus kobensis]
MGIRKSDRHKRKAPQRTKITVDAEGVRNFLAPVAAQLRRGAACAFVCIGTDCSTGDAFGPLVGTALKARGWSRVYGTMEHPLDAVRLSSEGIIVPEDTIVVTIDACLGKADSVGKFAVAEGPLQPGEGVGLQLPPIGDYSIAAVVNQLGPKPYWTLQTTSLHLVMRLADEAAEAIDDALREAVML